MFVNRADCRFAPNQWKTALLCNDFSHWLSASLVSILCTFSGLKVLILLFPFQVDDPKVLPHYPYRDDSLLLHQAVKKYVSQVLAFFYGIVNRNQQRGLNKTITICKCRFETFSRKNNFISRLKFRWNVFLGVQSTVANISSGNGLAPSMSQMNYLRQWWASCLT